MDEPYAYVFNCATNRLEKAKTATDVKFGTLGIGMRGISHRLSRSKGEYMKVYGEPTRSIRSLDNGTSIEIAITYYL